MNIKYEFLTGEAVEIEVPDDIGELSIEIDRNMVNSNRRETRRHNSINRMEEAGVQFADARANITELVFENETNSQMRAALSSLLPQQQALIRQVFFEERSLAAIARDLKVTEGAVRHRLSKIYKRLKTFLG